MLLGIVLHSLMSFIDLPAFLTPAQDIHQRKEYRVILEAIHGFRLPLFFLISGFFTSLMWRKRGLNFTIRHRAKRIGLPLMLGMFTVVPLVFVIGFLSFALGLSSNRLHEAAKSGELSFIERSGTAGSNLNKTLLIGSPEPKGLAALHQAVLHKQADAVNLLLEHGANPDVRQAGADQLGVRPLHIAAGSGDVEIASALLSAGADVNARASAGFTALDVARGKKFALGGTFERAILDPAEIRAMIALLRAEGGLSGESFGDPAPVEAGDKGEEELFYDMFVGLPGWFMVLLGLCAFPVFAHLWFLWYLSWLVAMFAMVLTLARRFGWRAPTRMMKWPGCVFVLVPITFVAQLVNFQSLGPDTAGGLVPWPPILFYYAIFFGFGALACGNPEFEHRAGRQWPLLIAVGLGALAIALVAKEARLEKNFAVWHSVLSLCASIYVWAMSFGLIGLFRRFFSVENTRIRYVSDASYWLYVTHLPVVLALQIWMTDWELPSIVKIFLIGGITTAVLLILYEYLVRYRWLGTVMNGKRVREKREN